MSRPSPSRCPKCGAEAPCTDWNEVDIGVGFQVHDEQWTCPTHGDFGYSPIERTLVFRDDVKDPSAAPTGGRL